MDSVSPEVPNPGLTLLTDPWYGPTDLQVVTSIQGLDLDVFPFGAYDTYGRLKVDPKVSEQLKRELRDVLTQPVWADLFEALSLFDNPGYDCFALGYRATRRGLKLVVFRQLKATSRPEACRILQETIAQQRLPQLRELAGRRYVIQPRWIEIVRKVLGLVGGSIAVQAGVGEPGDEPDAAAVAAAIGWSAALKIVLQILEIANEIGRAPRVDCTVVWRYLTWASIPQKDTARWYSIATVATSPACTCTGVLWDRAGRKVWNWTKHKPWPSGFSFTPDGLARSLYPSGLVTDADVAPEAAASVADEGA